MHAACLGIVGSGRSSYSSWTRRPKVSKAKSTACLGIVGRGRSSCSSSSRSRCESRRTTRGSRGRLLENSRRLFVSSVHFDVVKLLLLLIWVQFVGCILVNVFQFLCHVVASAAPLLANSRRHRLFLEVSCRSGSFGRRSRLFHGLPWILRSL
jgi:hypothetical protein